MPDELDGIIERMINAGEPEENIAAVIRAHTAPKPGSGLNKPITSATTWGQGVLDSLTNGEAANAGWEGLKGYVKGAVNIPKTLMNTIGTARKLPNPIMGGMMNMGGDITNPDDINDIFQGLKATPGQMWDTTKQAGTHPEEFGEMMGELTGQPLLTEGLSRIPGSALTKGVRTAGKAVSKTGKFVENVKPASAMIPRVVEPRIAGMAEGAAGRGLSKIGDAMQQTGIPKVLRNSDYGPVPFEGRPTTSPTADMRGSMAYPETSTRPSNLITNEEYGPVNFTPDGPLKAPTGMNKGGMSYPETNPYDPSLTLNSDYGPTEFTPDNPLKAPNDRGAMSYPELNDTPPSLVPNSSAAADDFIPNGKSITGPNKGSVSYPEMTDTPPSLVPNSQAGMDEFMGSMEAPGGEMRGGMSYPEMNPMPEGVMHNTDYGPVDFEPPPPKGGMEYSGPIEGRRASPWGEANNATFGNGPDLWNPPEGEPTQIINPPTDAPTQPIAKPELAPPPKEFTSSIGDDGVFDLSNMGDMKDIFTQNSAHNMDLRSADIINPRGPEYIKKVLNQAEKGKPGFNAEGNKLVYRGADGKPVGVAVVKGDTIVDFVVSKTGDRATRVAASKALREEITKRGISKVEGGMTPDAKRVFDRTVSASM